MYFYLFQVSDFTESNSGDLKQISDKQENDDDESVSMKSEVLKCIFLKLIMILISLRNYPTILLFIHICICANIS